MAVCQLADWALIHRYRGQAPSHIFTAASVSEAVKHAVRSAYWR